LSTPIPLLDILQVRCPENAVYVYDGLPAYVGRYAGGSRLLGSLCTEDVPEDGDLRLEASSGIMTIHYSEVCVSHVSGYI
jgi:hypothetical protein